MPASASALVHGAALIMGANSTDTKIVNITGMANGSANQIGYWGYGLYVGSSVISSISLRSSTGNFDAGTVYVYGA
jgi:hypothetical protein